MQTQSNSTTTSRAYPLYEGTFSVGTDKKFNRIDRDDPPAKGALKISLNPFLIKTEERNYLIDVGIGDFGEDTSTETIKENLAAHDVADFEITDIICSHLHYDHIGGLAGRSSGFWELTFPDARLWVSGKDWEKATGKDTYYDDEKTQFLHFIDARADLHFLEDQDQPYPELTVEKIGGHTEFSQVIWFDDGHARYMMAGDVLAVRGEVNRKFAAKYDYDPDRSMEARKELLKKAYQEEYTIMGYHDSHYPLFRLSDYNEKQGYVIENIEADVSS
ncbi:MBL fold metallo-hydrolase [Aliifodinibius sp. S!AR15-10]|uniref:MBL fold metallo-hydrolase n=1 Tax=Aliifodinibius sp. S!AR15-10 TaxID=2950437 RepID=UPI0028660C30|nr:MBL fold metallo-hydrolase [Aliifodinibius sp. S!AR15-10]MDR8392918.1 MBL fold metallo-hydrolase [Aliifodinibius sp. S!AR15-10]